MLPPITHRAPPAPFVLRLVGWLMLKIFGWRTEGQAPDIAKAVVICGAHTSQWDLYFALAGCWAFGITPMWLGKQELFDKPWGGFLRWTGGIAVDRRSPHGLVDQVADKIRSSEGAFVMVPPEGTRAWAPYWKSGFYWIAVHAEVPFALGYLDFKRKVAGFGPALTPTGDPRVDMEHLRTFYADKAQLYPECVGPIRLKVEDEPGEQG